MKKAVVILVLALAACGNIPQPFRGGPNITAHNPLLDVPTAVGIAVLPVRGAPEPMGTQISTAAASRLQDFEIPAEAVPVNKGLGFTLESEATEVEAASADQVSVVVTWTLKSRRGVPAGTYRQVVSLPAAAWRTGDAALSAQLGQEAAGAIGGLVSGIALPAQGPVPAATPLPPPPRPTFMTVSVKPVEGAPGDGRESLRLAVLQMLAENGVKRDDVDPQVVLTCEMTRSSYDTANQKVEILWKATARDGSELGTVRLDNTIPTGALDGRWGPTAFAVAAAAANDLLTLLLAPAAPPAKPQNP